MAKSAGGIKPSNCISVLEARELQDNWMATRGIDIEESLGSQDTREFLFSVAELQQFLDYVKSASSTDGVINPGVRVYLGAYDNDATDRATVFLAPTKGTESGAENNYSIEPLNRGISGHPPKNY